MNDGCRCYRNWTLFMHWNSCNRLRIHYLTMMHFIEIVFVHFVIRDYGIFGGFVYTFCWNFGSVNQCTINEQKCVSIIRWLINQMKCFWVNWLIFTNWLPLKCPCFWNNFKILVCLFKRENVFFSKKKILTSDRICWLRVIIYELKFSSSVNFCSLRARMFSATYSKQNALCTTKMFNVNS